MEEKQDKSRRWLFSVAPMMDWTGTSQRAKRIQHLSHVSIGHVAT
jgi:hypothetical protein